MFFDFVGSSVIGVVGLLLFVGNVYALVHLFRTRPDAFIATSKQTKKFWTWVLVGCVIARMVFGLMSIVGILSIVAVIVYLVDVRPAINEILRRPRY